ncbi:FimV/HubP family polar landmark protein [Rheinheimera baltica]|uniref:FimV/HubP family polar landmark protein n=1 Tax=Rheinheimera baltica TaxID=67576 RepID=UPI00273DDF4B|nr:FimV/HubP family polar landmark protein [Rheinheimera baltica]MDP5190874.1 hypothetical protein [Rheinheimera baltica]
MPLLFVFFITVLVNFPSFVQAQDTSTQLRGPRSTDAPLAPVTIGPLSPADTLWRVAERIRTDPSISLYQVMYALYLKNPDAFLDNNLNHLRPNSVLLLPTMAEMRQVDVNTAKQKSEQDDKNWAQRQKNASSNTDTNLSDASSKQQRELERISKQQREDLERQQSQFADSMQQVELIAEENRQLKASLINVEQELALIKAQLGQDSELQQQISQLLAQQAELLKAKSEQEAIAAEQIDWQQWFKNPIAWILAACIPALLILFGILLWVKKRGRQTEKVVHAATSETAPNPTYHSPLPPLDDNNDLDESLFEIDDALLEDTFSDAAEPQAVTIEDDLLDLDDELSFEDDSLLPSDAPGQGDDALSMDDSLELDDTFDPDNILSDTDLSALLAAEDDDDDVFIELADNSAEMEDVALDEVDDTVVSHLADDDFEMTSEPDVAEDDIDALLAQVNATNKDDTDTDGSDAENWAEDVEIEDIDIEEIDLDEIQPDEIEQTSKQDEIVLSTSVISAQEQQLAASLDDNNDILAEEVAASVDVDHASNADIDSFDSSELEEFAESLVTESLNAESSVTESLDSESLDLEGLDLESLVTDSTNTELPDDTEELSVDEDALLSAELTDLLDQAEDLNTRETELLQENVALSDSDVVLESDALSDSDELVDKDDSEDDLLDSDELVDKDDSEDDLLSESLETESDDSSVLAPDLTANDDGSVTRVTEAALSVENPSKMLEQYPELELTDDDVEIEPQGGDESELDAEMLLEDFEVLPDVDDLSELLNDTDDDDHASDSDLLEHEEQELDPIEGAQFDSMLSELETIADNLDATESDVSTAPTVDVSETENGFDFNEDDFVEIDTLLANAELQDQDPDRFNQLNVDVGLNDYKDIIGEHERRDVDKEDNGYAAKLDLARAYIEMDDREIADLLLDSILASDAPDHIKEEAQNLK